MLGALFQILKRVLRMNYFHIFFRCFLEVVCKKQKTYVIQLQEPMQNKSVELNNVGKFKIF